MININENLRAKWLCCIKNNMKVRVNSKLYTEAVITAKDSRTGIITLQVDKSHLLGQILTQVGLRTQNLTVIETENSKRVKFRVDNSGHKKDGINTNDVNSRKWDQRLETKAKVTKAMEAIVRAVGDVVMPKREAEDESPATADERTIRDSVAKASADIRKMAAEDRSR